MTYDNDTNPIEVEKDRAASPNSKGGHDIMAKQSPLPLVTDVTLSADSLINLFSAERSKNEQRDLRFHEGLRANFTAAVATFVTLRQAPNRKDLLSAVAERFSLRVKQGDMIGIVLQGLTDYWDAEADKIVGPLSRDRAVLTRLLETGIPPDKVDAYIQGHGGVSGVYKEYLDNRPVKKKRKRKGNAVATKVASVLSVLKRHLQKPRDEVLLLAEKSGTSKLAPWSKKIPKLSAEARAKFTAELDELVEKYSAIASDAVGTSG